MLHTTVNCYDESVIGEPGILISTNADYSNLGPAQPQHKYCTGLHGPFCNRDCETLMVPTYHNTYMLYCFIYIIYFEIDCDKNYLTCT